MKDAMTDNAIKFGAGRYIQSAGALDMVGSEVKSHGDKVFIITGHRSWDAVSEKLLRSLKEAGVSYVLEQYQGTCNFEDAKRLAQKVQDTGCQEVLGVGGGVIMDFAKAIGHYSETGVINVPTSIATCAAFTTMSIMYTPEGKSDSNFRYTKEIDGIIVDLDVIVNCPARYAAAGILDAMAKKIEMQHNHEGMSAANTSCDFFTAYSCASYTYDSFVKFGLQAIRDIENHIVTKAVNDIVFLTVAVTGMLSNITRSYNQAALGHQLYYAARTEFTKMTRKYLHGEIVAVGLLLQLRYNGQMDQEAPLLEYMKAMKMPTRLDQIGIAITDENLLRLQKQLATSRFINGGAQVDRLKASMAVLL